MPPKEYKAKLEGPPTAKAVARIYYALEMFRLNTYIDHDRKERHRWKNYIHRGLVNGEAPALLEEARTYARTMAELGHLTAKETLFAMEVSEDLTKKIDECWWQWANKQLADITIVTKYLRDDHPRYTGPPLDRAAIAAIKKKALNERRNKH